MLYIKNAMTRGIVFVLLGLICLSHLSCQLLSVPSSCGAIPNEQQMKWQEMEYYAFIHFSINTYTDQEWGDGGNKPALFNPTDLDCRQWARICKQAGMKGIILTAKHHDGFCLWPSEYTEYSVKNSPWRNGKGDLVKELAEACKEYGLKLGIYLSPWDRNHPDYGRPEYVTYFRNQLKELLTNYGEIFEVWFDGANGGWGYYGGAREDRKIDRKTFYDWDNTIQLIRQLQPNAIIWNECGPDIRWCGNEHGSIGETNWSLFDAHEYAPGTADSKVLRVGRESDPDWVPGEVNVSVRPGWFYHAYEDAKVKTLPQLLEIYYNSIGRNGTWLLNFPIDRRGMIHENDEKAVLDLASTIKEIFANNLAENAKIEASHVRGNSRRFSASRVVDGKKSTYWSTDDSIRTASLTLDFGEPISFNRILLQEYIRLGQRVRAFTIEANINGEWKEMARETTIGYKRILRLPTVKATQIRFTVTDSKACPVISNIAVYNAPQILTEPKITRNKTGEILIYPADKESLVYYTLDGTEPTLKSAKYVGPVFMEGKGSVRAMSVDPVSRKKSQVSREEFGISRKDWNIHGINDPNVNNILDGEQHTAWHRREGVPSDLIIDLGQEYDLTGFRYLPDQSYIFPSGIISQYEFSVSTDNKHWKLVSSGEFSNIRNNPLWQIKRFKQVKGRYIKFRALKNTHNNDIVGYAEIDILTL